MRPRTDRAAVVAAALLAAACPSRKSEPAAPPPKGAGPVSGVKVPLPEGWRANTTPEGALLLGPPGREVLRIDVKPGAGSRLPTPAALEQGFRKSLEGAQVSELDHESREDAALVVLSVEDNTHKPGATLVVLLGAKRVGMDLYLCSTLPGTSAEDVKLAVGACREIHTP